MMVRVVDLGATIVRVGLLATVMCALASAVLFAVPGANAASCGSVSTSQIGRAYKIQARGISCATARTTIQNWFRSSPGARNWKGWRFIFHSGPPEHYVASKGSKKVTFRLSDGESE